MKNVFSTFLHKKRKEITCYYVISELCNTVRRPDKRYCTQAKGGWRRFRSREIGNSFSLELEGRFNTFKRNYCLPWTVSAWKKHCKTEKITRTSDLRNGSNDSVIWCNVKIITNDQHIFFSGLNGEYIHGGIGFFCATTNSKRGIWSFFYLGVFWNGELHISLRGKLRYEVIWICKSKPKPTTCNGTFYKFGHARERYCTSEITADLSMWNVNSNRKHRSTL